MSTEPLAPELEARIRELEAASETAHGFTGGDWVFLVLSGVVFPALLLWWGWTA